MIAETVGPELVRRGLKFVGIDVIGDYLTEINVTSPTGIRELDRDLGINVAARLLDAVQSKVERGQRSGYADTREWALPMAGPTYIFACRRQLSRA